MGPCSLFWCSFAFIFVRIVRIWMMFIRVRSKKKLFDSSEVCFRTWGQNTFVRLGFNYIDHITFIYQFQSKRSATVWRIVKISVRFKPTAFVFVRFVIFIFFWKKSFFFSKLCYIFIWTRNYNPSNHMHVYFLSKQIYESNERTN